MPKIKKGSKIKAGQGILAHAEETAVCYYPKLDGITLEEFTELVKDIMKDNPYK